MLATGISLFSIPSAAAHPVFEKIYIVLKVNNLDRFNIATHSSNLPTIRFRLVGLTAWIASFHHVRDHSVKLIAFFLSNNLSVKGLVLIVSLKHLDSHRSLSSLRYDCATPPV